MKAPHSIFFKETKGRQNWFLRNVSMLLAKIQKIENLCPKNTLFILFVLFSAGFIQMNNPCLKFFFIHIGIMIMINILSQNVRFSLKAGFHLQWSRSWSRKWSWKNQKVFIFFQLHL